MCSPTVIITRLPCRQIPRSDKNYIIDGVELFIERQGRKPYAPEETSVFVLFFSSSSLWCQGVFYHKSEYQCSAFSQHNSSFSECSMEEEGSWQLKCMNQAFKKKRAESGTALRINILKNGWDLETQLKKISLPRGARQVISLLSSACTDRTTGIPLSPRCACCWLQVNKWTNWNKCDVHLQ